jgi:endonuclease/exonuclease/phosphatase family metal-dependent hydrolase
MSMLRPFVVVLLLAATASAQTVPPRGADATFDVAAWNVEHFGSPSGGPSNDAQQLANVTAVVRQAEIDLWGFEEIVDAVEWGQLVSSLAADGYAGILGPSVSSSPAFNMRLGFLYDTAVVSIITTRSILIANQSSFGGRAPFEMIANVTLNGVTRQVRFIVVHAKAGGGQDDYQDRLAGAAALKTYTDAYVQQGIAFIVMGDFNDELTTSIASGQLSPYRAFVQDADRYTFATRGLDQTNTNTYCSNSTCSSGSTLDHLLIGSPLIGTYVAGSGDRYAELLSAIPGYVGNTSDHLPVLAHFDLMMTSAADGPATAGAAPLAPAAPSPFGLSTTLTVTLARAAVVRLDVVDVLGRTVAVLLDGTLAAGDHPARLDGARLAPGVYVARLTADGRTATQTLVRSR